MTTNLRLTKIERIVVTGGPGAGKTAVLELARKLFCNHVAILPEAASIIFKGGFLRHDNIAAKRAAQIAIFHVQRQLENIILDEAESIVCLCDRGTIDGEVYWPDEDKSNFWKEVNVNREEELNRYKTVLHLCSPSDHYGYNHQNPLRIESAKEAGLLDFAIQKAWAKHPNRYIIKSNHDFTHKAMEALKFLKSQIYTCPHAECNEV